MSITEQLTQKAGPLPVWAWGGIGAVGFGVFLLATRGPSRDGDNAVQGQPITPIATGDNHDPSGNLAAVNGMLTELMGRLNGNGQGPGGGGVSTMGMAAANELGAHGANVQAQNTATIAKIKQELDAAGANINTGAGFEFYLIERNLFHNKVQAQIDDVLNRAHVASINLGPADAAYVNMQAQSLAASIRGQYMDWDTPWQRGQGVAI